MKIYNCGVLFFAEICYNISVAVGESYERRNTLEIFHSIKDIPPTPCVVALGCFDGVHKGHEYVLNMARKRANELGVIMCVFAFAEPPKNYFAPNSAKLLSTTEQKLEFFRQCGADRAVCVPFNKKIADISALDFINKLLIDTLRARHFVCGYNYTFGKNAEGTTDLLHRICVNRNVGVTVTPDICIDELSVSSSLIRTLLAEGDIQTAAYLLGRNYSISGEVIAGQHLARTLGFPTVNIIPDEKMQTPMNGVYLTSITFDGIKKYGITNVGIRPTVNTKIKCAETHIFDFEGDLYGKTVTFEFIGFLREEKKFPNVKKLAEQIEDDISVAKEWAERIEAAANA